ncbi:MAG: hypothetical protein PHX44_08465 [Sulfurimonas sp.]|uniref:hypothetical protein n=1 Tax=Sulfurimonas sp. TaxID=2022749 RepID=UPI0026298F49|nr:hypothetical protein [Sulfurimonas sp.]MDD2653066.1 hypothetical protein [Sulfurimonas sp.]MDD3452511.1 hypothetical protein [Sulfurimonas sp.]
MSQILLLDKLLKEYRLWTLKLISSSDDIYHNILQKGSGKAIEEKLISIITASVTLYVVTGVLSFFGLYTGGFFMGTLFFMVGLLFSRYLNKKIFGTERKEEDLKDDEKVLLSNLRAINETHKTIRGKINDGSMLVNFRDYARLSQEFDSMLKELREYKATHLAYKYRLSHKIAIGKYGVQVKRFNAIYAHKD